MRCRVTPRFCLLTPARSANSWRGCLNRLSISDCPFTPGLQSAADCLSQIVRFIQDRTLTTPIVLQTLARTALLGGARVVFVLGSENANERDHNAKIVLRQESTSLMRLYDAAEKFNILRVSFLRERYLTLSDRGPKP